MLTREVSNIRKSLQSSYLNKVNKVKCRTSLDHRVTTREKINSICQIVIKAKWELEKNIDTNMNMNCNTFNEYEPG